MNSICMSTHSCFNSLLLLFRPLSPHGRRLFNNKGKILVIKRLSLLVQKGTLASLSVVDIEKEKGFVESHLRHIRPSQHLLLVLTDFPIDSINAPNKRTRSALRQCLPLMV